MITLKQVAERCGYSIATVSKALNRLPDINPQTAKEIRKIARAMGYQPNTAARTLKTNRSRIIGLLFFLRGECIWTHDYFSSIAASIQDVMQARDYDISPINCDGAAREGSYVDYCRYRSYDGVIVMSAGFTEKTLLEFIHSDIPLVTIDYSFPHRSSVLSDNAHGMQTLVRHVYSLGHRRIAFIHGEDTRVTQERLKGFRDVCRDLSMEVPEEYVVASYYRDEAGSMNATRKLMQLPQPPSCILYPDDYACISGINTLEKMGLKVPEDISVAGYDGIKLSQLLRPKITTLRQDDAGIGRNAAELLLDTIENRDDFVAQHVMLPGWLLKGETVCDLSALTQTMG